jgi:hypothetical protein
MIAALDRLALLVIGEFRLAPHLHAACLGAVVVSTHVSCSERKPAPLPVIVASVLKSKNFAQIDPVKTGRRVIMGGKKHGDISVKDDYSLTRRSVGRCILLTLQISRCNHNGKYCFRF